jgi:hypothetical protein
MAHDIKHEYGFAIVTGVNKKVGKRYIIPGTVSALRRDAWSKIGDKSDIALAKKRGLKAKRVTIIPGTFNPKVRP